MHRFCHFSPHHYNSIMAKLPLNSSIKLTGDGVMMRFSAILVRALFIFCLPVGSQLADESATTLPTPMDTTQPPIGPFSVEILAIFVPPGISNAVQVVWGGDGVPNGANLTYGVYFGSEDGDLEYPKLTTPNVSALIIDLEYCTKYNFAVTVLDGGATSDTVKINPNTVRTVITGAEQLAPPLNLTVDLEARAQPCINIRWSAACPTVTAPVGYVVSVLDKKLAKYKVLTLPPTQRSDLVYRLPVQYDDILEIRVSSTFPGSKAVGPVEYQVPAQLQPFKVRVTVNEEDGAFVIYWAEPFVPLMVGRYYYQLIHLTGTLTVTSLHNITLQEINRESFLMSQCFQKNTLRGTFL
uniref:Fibronectin type-III domain-containing protein n=1 Tax=Dendroctonus ponderosae TaxID=77166 RepID=A0AAR5PE66_DENPD